jgi:hypothetical protein
MKRTIAAVVGVAIGALIGVALIATLGHTEPRAQHPYGTPIGPVMPRDKGTGEMLIAVVGGVYATQGDAVAANDQMPFADLAGYYVVPIGQFDGLQGQLSTPGQYALASVFRTETGAFEFAAFARSLGYPATILPLRIRSLGGVYAGLGQEANPDGSGPLTGPIPASLP